MKVTYYDREDGRYTEHTTKAYLDETPLPDGSYVGTNKHTEIFVHVRWDPTAGEDGAWLEVCERVYGPYDMYSDSFPEIVDQRPACTCWELGQ